MCENKYEKCEIKFFLLKTFAPEKVKFENVSTISQNI